VQEIVSGGFRLRPAAG